MSRALSATGASDVSQLGPSPTTSRRSGPPVGASVADIAAWLDARVRRGEHEGEPVTVHLDNGMRLPWTRGFLMLYLAKAIRAGAKFEAWSDIVCVRIDGRPHYMHAADPLPAAEGGEGEATTGGISGGFPAPAPASAPPSAADLEARPQPMTRENGESRPAGHTLQSLLRPKARRPVTPEPEPAFRPSTNWQRTQALYTE